MLLRQQDIAGSDLRVFERIADRSYAAAWNDPRLKACQEFVGV
jgi:hypothetical protein